MKNQSSLRWLLAVMALAAALFGCVDSALPQQGGVICPRGQQVQGERCGSAEEIAACATVVQSARCATSAISNGWCDAGICYAIVCGDGTMAPGEICDDGNTADNDGCKADCLSKEVCGDSVVNRGAGESCDDGNQVDGDGCQANCKFAVCGDGIKDATEDCDDGTANSDARADACRTSCRHPSCGDGVIDAIAGEKCDDSNRDSGDGCTFDCAKIERCGDGVTDSPAEQCDDANEDDDDACHPDCQLPKCGDGIVDAPFESCDAGAANSDDPNLTPGGAAGCRSNCQSAGCGDSVLDTGLGEVCDDGNRRDVIAGSNDFDGCAANCLSIQTCGNGYLDFNPDPARSEECDPAGSIAGLSHDGCSSTCEREVGDWNELGNPAPSPRASYAMAYDSRRNRMVIFGGFDTKYLNDTWEWDNVALRWTHHVTAHAPTERRYHSMVYDEARGVVVMFGGSTVVGITADTWEYDGNDWRPIVSNVVPSARYLFGMSYDSDQRRVLMFGGLNANSSAANSELWQFDGAQWLQMIPVGTVIQPRYGSGQAYDSRRHKLVVFAGYDSHDSVDPNLRADTWEFDVATKRWTDVTPATGPQGRYQCPMEFDAAFGKVVMFGGNGYWNDTWTWDGVTWQPMAPIVTPSARNGVAIAYDSRSRGLILFGGFSTQPENDVWQLVAASTYFVWQQRPSTHVPSKRAFGQASISSLDGTVLMFGGLPGVIDTWTWHHATGWYKLLDNQGPPSRRNAAMVFDSKHNRFLLFGGDSGNARLNDLWSFSQGRWTELSQSIAPSPRFGSGAYYDVARDRFVLVGGAPAGAALNDTWEYDCSADTWEQILTVGRPPANYAGALVYDSKRQRGVLVPGVTALASDTWFYDGAQRQWSSLPVEPAAVAPPPRSYASMVYDPLRDATVLMGGYGTGGSLLDDLWELRNEKWQRVPSRTLPAPRYGAVAVFDSVSSSTVLVGGQTIDYRNDTWQWQWSSIEERTQACPPSTAAGNVDTDSDGLDSDDDPDCWWRRTPLCPPGTSCM